MRPLPVKSPAAIAYGPPGTGIGGRAVERAVAVAQEDGDLVEVDGSATARSVRPSPLKSAATIDDAPLPAGKATVKGCWNVPSPLPGRMVTLSEPWLTTARPRLPLPVKSPVATATAVVADRVGGRFLEGAVAFAQEHGDVVGVDVSRGQVEAAVAVEIAGHESDRRPCPAGDSRTLRGLERPVAVAQEHRDIVGVGVGDGQVEMAVAEVARHDRERDSPRLPVDDG